MMIPAESNIYTYIAGNPHDTGRFWYVVNRGESPPAKGFTVRSRVLEPQAPFDTRMDPYGSARLHMPYPLLSRPLPPS